MLQTLSILSKRLLLIKRLKKVAKKITKINTKERELSKTKKLFSRLSCIKGEMIVAKNNIALGFERLINKPLK